MSLDMNTKSDVGLQKKLQDRLKRRESTSTLRRLTLPDLDHVDFSSNDFLSLSNNRDLKSAYLTELQKTDQRLGSGGSRLLDGNSVYAEELERKIASYHGAEAGLLFNSGYDANAGFFSCVPQPGDVVVYDELVHASVHDGMRLSRASRTVPFLHNSVRGLRDVLSQILEEHGEGVSIDCSIIIAVEAVYSMDGDVAPLNEIVAVVDEIIGPERGHVVVDEAHATGVLGPNGKGLVCDHRLEDKVFARLHTFGKSLTGNGAIILGSSVLREYLVNYARPLIYTTALSYPCLALIKSSYVFMQAGSTAALQDTLRTLINTFHRELTAGTLRCGVSHILQIPQICPKSPIFSIRLQRPKQLAKYLQQRGMTVRAIVPPTVPIGTQRIRICLHAGNTIPEVESLAGALFDWVQASVGTATKENPERSFWAKANM